MSLFLGWHTANVFVYEIVFHIDIHDSPLDLPLSKTAQVWKSSAVRMDLLLGCLEAAKAHFDYFLQLPDTFLQSGGILDVARISYSILALGKLALGAGLAYDNTIVRERSNLVQYFDALLAKFESLRATLGEPEAKNVFYHFKRVFAYNRTWFENGLLEGGVIFDGSSSLRDPKELSPMAMIDDGQEAMFVKQLRHDTETAPSSLDSIWDEIMNDWSPTADTLRF